MVLLEFLRLEQDQGCEKIHKPKTFSFANLHSRQLIKAASHNSFRSHPKDPSKKKGKTEIFLIPVFFLYY